MSDFDGIWNNYLYKKVNYKVFFGKHRKLKYCILLIQLYLKKENRKKACQWLGYKNWLYEVWDNLSDYHEL